MEDSNADSIEAILNKLTRESMRSMLESDINELLDKELIDWMTDVVKRTGKLPVKNGFYTRTVKC